MKLRVENYETSVAETPGDTVRLMSTKSLIVPIPSLAAAYDESSDAGIDSQRDHFSPK